ncbi:MAG TPA: hypothetical protein GXX51_00285 [Firmicutes bacterium]|nr:hypothetical protein [Bacillota bacterium]
MPGWLGPGLRLFLLFGTLVIGLVVVNMWIPVAAAGGPADPGGAGDLGSASGPGVSEGFSEDYLLGPGDVLEISVWGYEDLAAVVTVRQDGKISFPLIGDIPASGRTIAQLRVDMSSKIAEYVKHPSVTVILKQPRVINVRVLGEVKVPGVYGLKHGQAVADAIAMAGGLTERGDDSNITVSGRRPSGPVSIRIDLAKALMHGEYGQGRDFTLEDGDTVFVPKTIQVQVMGQVHAPGAYLLPRGARLLDAVARAGGVRPDGEPASVTLSRPQTPQAQKPQAEDGREREPSSEPWSIKVDLGKLMTGRDLSLNIPLEDGDVIFVPEAVREVSVLGEVNRPGVYPIHEGSRLLDAIAAAGGPTPEGDTTCVTLVRREGDRDREGGSDGKTVTFKVDLDRLSGQQDAGQSGQGAGRGTGENYLLKNGDTIYVPKAIRVQVLGEVYTPGVYLMRARSTVTDAIAKGGGVKPTGDGANVTLTRTRGGVSTQTVIDVEALVSAAAAGNAESVASRAAGDATVANLTLEDGDILFVPPAFFSVSVLGEVQRPGVYQMKKGSRLLDALAEAGGIGKEGDPTMVTLMRKASSEVMTVNLDQGLGHGPDLAPGDVITVPKALKVQVLGQVQAPGTYFMPRGARVMDAIGEAGGLKPDAGASAIMLTQPGRPGKQLSWEEMLSGDPTENQRLSDGDVIFVPEAPNEVSVLGEVARPGVYKVYAGTRLLDVIAAAGGVTPEGDTSSVTITRALDPVAPVDPGGPGAHNAGARVQTLKVDLDALSRGAMAGSGGAENIPIKRGDVVYVPERIREVTVLGEVARPGTYPIRGEMRVLDVIAAAGGPTVNGDTTSVTLTTKRGGAKTVLNIDLDRIAAGDPNSENYQVSQGDVIYIPRAIEVQVLGQVTSPGSYRLKANSRLTEAIARAGGIKQDGDPSRVSLTRMIEEGPEGSRVIMVNVDDILEGRARDADYRLKEGDIISVPEAERRVLVVGEVKHPGIYTVRKGALLMDAIALAGGPTDRAALESVCVFSGGKVATSRQVNMGMDDLLFKGDVKENPAIKGGDIVYVPETKKPDWSKVFSFLSGLKLLKDLILP